MLAAFILWFLRRPTAAATWRYERRAFLAVEVLCLAAVVLVAPAGAARTAALLVAPLALWQAELSREAASAERRRAEEDARRGVERSALHCDVLVRRNDASRAVVAWLWPALGTALPAAVAGAIVRPALVALAVTLVRMFRDRVAYPAWRAWWVRARAETATG